MNHRQQLVAIIASGQDPRPWIPEHWNWQSFGLFERWDEYGEPRLVCYNGVERTEWFVVANDLAKI